MLKIKVFILLILTSIVCGCSISTDGFQKEKQEIIDDCLNNNGETIIEYYKDGSGISNVKCIIKADLVEKVD